MSTTSTTKYITIRFEVDQALDKDEFLEAITKVVHESPDVSHLFNHVIDVQDNDNPVE